MSTPTQPVCDECGAVKGATNNWFHVGSGVHHIKIEHSRPGRKGWGDICGEACLHKYLSKWMNKSQEGAPATAGSTQQEEPLA